MCDPRILPHCPIDMNIGIPVAFLVSDPRLCVTRRVEVNRQTDARQSTSLHHAMVIPIVV